MHKPADSISDVVARLNERYAMVLQGGEVSIMSTKRDEETGRLVRTYLSEHAFKSLLRNRPVWIGKRRTHEANVWLDDPNRNTYESVIFDPSLEPGQQSHTSAFNLWTGWPVAPRKGKCERFHDHLYHVGAAGDDEAYNFLIDWFAWMVTEPCKSPMSAIAFHGGQGVGKGTIMEMFARLVGQHYLHIAQLQHLVGHFNAHLQDTLLLFADEAMWAGDKQGEGALKTLITEKSILIERKGRDPVMMPNRVHLVIATNHDWAVPMETDDRRFFVIECPAKYQGKSSYFAAIRQEISNGGAEAFFWELMNRRLDHAPRIPKSEALLASALKQKIRSMTPIERWWYGKLDSGQLIHGQDGWPSEVARNALHDDYISTMAKLQITRRASETELGLYIQKILPDVPTIRRIGLGRCWLMPTLQQCRESFALLMRMPGLWGPDPDDL